MRRKYEITITTELASPRGEARRKGDGRKRMVRREEDEYQDMKIMVDKQEEKRG